MIKIAKYFVSEELFSSADTVVYRGERIKDGQAVILKLLNKEYPSSEEINRFRHEYDILKGLDIKGVIKVIALESHDNLPVLVMEDTKGSRSLKQIIDQDAFSLKNFLKTSIQIVEALGRIHEQRIIHKDIKPHNIILCRKTGEIKVIDFGLATRLTDESQAIISADALQVTLAYVSPEQTGRMNRSIDYRTDFYSLGITFYEMLAGTLPFKADDPMGWVHAHIAKTSEPLYKKKLDIPKAISDIVTKLIAKNAEDRYQSAYGLKYDLQKCLKQLQESGKIEKFTVGQQDIPWQLRIPQKLYGRDSEIKRLLRIFNEVAKGKSEIMLVAGYSGVGKSALVNEIQKPVTENRGYYISGKFDQFQRNLPYSAIIQAFRELIRQFLTESDEQINEWKKKLLKCLGTNGQVIIDVIPEVELIIGKQEAVAELGPTESINRFNMVFQNFINVFAQKNHPLVVFLDDLQWVDSASLNLIKTLITDPDSSYLFFMGAYRDNEVDQTHPLKMTLDEIQKTIPVHNLFLKPLELSHLDQLICETLYQTTEKCRSLAILVAEKTGGNPFFVNEFLKSLYRKQLLKVNFEKGEWQWDMKKINKQNFTDNVVELMASHIMELPQRTQNILKMAACIGDKFDLKVLSVVSKQCLSDTIKDIWKAVEDGLIITTGDFDQLYNLASKKDTDIGILEKMAKGYHKFLHDRVYQAAYSLISDKKKKHLHLRIGELLLENTKKDDMDEKIFEIVGQLNQGLELIEDKGQKLQLAKLNMEAGKKAKKATAYSSGVEHYTTAIDLLSENAWEEQYELIFECKKDLAEVSYLSGNYNLAESLYVELIERASSSEDKIKVYLIQMLDYFQQGRYEEALNVQKEGLNILGLELPDTEEQLQALLEQELKKVPTLLDNRKISDLINLPDVKDENICSIMFILCRVWIVGYVFGNNTMVAWSSVKMTNLSLEHGNSEYSSFAYVNYGFYCSAVLDDYNTSNEYGKLAIGLCERFYRPAIACPVFCLYGAMIFHWKKSVKLSIKYFKKGYECGMEGGDFAWASYNLLFVQLYSTMTGDLEKIHDESLKILQIAKKINPSELPSFHAMTNYLFKLRGLIYEEPVLKFDEIDVERDLAHPMILSWIYTPEMQALYYFEDYENALKLAQKSESMAISRPGQSLRPDTYYYASLIFIQCYAKATDNDKKKYLETIERYQKKMKIWADHCEANYLHKYLLIEAEKARITEKNLDPMNFYDQAIESAKEYEFINHAALGNELAAKFWLEKNKHKFATLYMTEARYLYQKWGATAKVKQLEEKYSRYIAIPEKTGQTSADKSSTIYSKSGVNNTIIINLDLNTVMKSTRHISGEIKLEKLLDSLLGNIIKYAGAQKGIIVLEDKGKFFIKAETTSDKNEIKVLQSEPVEQSEKLPQEIINYVERTSENIVLDDAGNEGPFKNAPYIIKNNSKSIMCTPVINQGKLIGMVYLENNSTTAIFTPDRLEIVNLLSSQAAISLENARLYANLENKVEKRTIQLKQARDALWGEMQLAKKIQTCLLPESDKEYHPEFDISATMIPADEVGGDFYEITLDRSGNLWLAIGDVSGHGVIPGLIMMMAQTAHATLTSNINCDPRTVVIKINETLYENVNERLRESHFMTFNALKYLGNGKFEHAGAHLSIIIYRQKSSKCELIKTKGIYFNFKKDISKSIKNLYFEMERQDIMILYTDGLTEAENSQGKILDISRFMRIVEKHAHLNSESMKEKVIDDVLQWSNNRQNDDMTLLIVKRK